VIAGGTLGIDTIRVGGPCGSVDQRAPGWRFAGETVEGGVRVLRRNRSLPGGGVLDVCVTKTGVTAWVEASVPRMVRGDNLRPASVREAVDVATGMTETASPWLHFEGPLSINRLDAARDIDDVVDMAPILLGLSGAAVAGRKVRDLYRDPQASSAQTLMTRNKSRAVRAYNKGEESGAPEAVNVLRLEAQTRRRALRSMGIGSLELLREEDVYKCGKSGFDWANLGAPLAPMDDALVKVLGADELTVPARLKLIGYMVACSHGMDASIDRRRRSDLRKSLQKVGAFTAETTNVVRLDFERGVVRESA
jgi:hypothetical protein